MKNKRMKNINNKGTFNSNLNNRIYNNNNNNNNNKKKEL